MNGHVLIAVDGSDPAEQAIEYAAINHSGDRITVIHVVNPADNLYGGVEGGYYSQDLFDQSVERGEKLCAQARDRLREAGVSDSTTIETTVEIGRPTQEIVEYTEENDVDHIVMGSHGRSGVSRLLLGSVAETVVRRAPVPVTIIR